jgi:transcriptional regulator with XRE-family HTH domain
MPRKLTNEQVLEMRERRAEGTSQRDLAADYGVAQALVSEIVRGLRYADAPGPIERVRRYYRRRNNSGG